MRQIPFNIDFRSKIEDGTYKVVTEAGDPVTIICWTANEFTPIVALVKGMAHNYYKDGQCLNHDICSDYNLKLLVEDEEWEPQVGDICIPKEGDGPKIHLCTKDDIYFSFVDEDRECGIAGGCISVYALKNEYNLFRRHKSLEESISDLFEDWFKRIKTPISIGNGPLIKKGKWYICTETTGFIPDEVNPEFNEGEAYIALDDGHLISNTGRPTEVPDDVDNYFREWTIADAKPGDFLASPDGEIAVFKSNNYNPITGEGCMFVYFGAKSYLVKCFREYGGINPTDWKPATGMQKNFLLDMVKKEGYKWDSEKLLLKKKLTPFESGLLELLRSVSHAEAQTDEVLEDMAIRWSELLLKAYTNNA